jgi:hypothetical protein
MKAIIQHNFNTGLGDFLNCIYEYFRTCENLKTLGYNRFFLKFYIQKNVYIHSEDFWSIFNILKFREIFEEIEIINIPITENTYFDCDWVYSCYVDKPGQHLWDLFLEKPNNNYYEKSIINYSYTKPEIEYLNIFDEKLIKKYEELKSTHLLDDYVSIYYRTFDLQDNQDSYENYKKYFQEIIENNNKIYVSSNSYLFKNYIKNYSDKIILYNIPGEDVAGNHYNYNKIYYDERELTKIRTEYVIFEMLTLSDSKNVNFFTLWNRDSNFLLLSKVKNVKIKNYTL